MRLKRPNCIMRAGGCIPATGRSIWRNIPLVETNKKNKRPAHFDQKKSILQRIFLLNQSFTSQILTFRFLVQLKGSSILSVFQMNSLSGQFISNLIAGIEIFIPASTIAQINQKFNNSLKFLCRFSLFLSDRSEEHTSELQSRENLVCRLLL